MSYITEEMKKGLINLIDETMDELDELKKSRFSASEIKIEGPGTGIDGKPSNGSLDAKKADDEDEDKDKDDKDDKDKEDVDKAEGTNRQADPNGGSHQPVAKGDEEDVDKAEGTNRQADPNGGSHQPVAKADDEEADDEEDDDDDDDKKKKKKNPFEKSVDSESDLKKSINESQDLMKSYVDSRFSSFEEKLEKMFNLVQDIADAPVPAKGSSYKNLTPLQKSADSDVEPLSKSELVDKLFDLKKTGTFVDSVDITSAELGSPADLAKIADKYSIN